MTSHRLGPCMILCLILLYACNKNTSNAYTSSESGFSYKLLAIGDGTVSASHARAVICEAVLRSSHDSVFFNSRYQAPQGFYIQLGQAPAASGKSQIASLSEGDSLSLIIGKTCLFRAYFDTLAPLFLQHDSVVKLDLKISRILRDAGAAENASSETEDRELQELKAIDTYLKQRHPQVQADASGLYVLEHHKTALEAVSAGKRVRVSYSGYYLSGEPIDNGRQQLEFVYGTPDQLVRGLNIVIGRLKKGETTKIIVPSRLAFGETGSTNGSIPPYTPLLYNLTLIDIK